VNDEDEKNPAPDASLCFKPRIELWYPNRLLLNSDMSGRYMMPLKKPLATRGTARKELTLLARTLKPEATPTPRMLGRTMLREFSPHA
jgi:hypothetical protein